MSRRSQLLRSAAAVAALALVTTACGDLLSGVGDLSEQVVHGDRPDTTTTTAGGAVDLRLKGITDVAWFNDGMDAATVNLSREDTIAAVWRDRENRGFEGGFIQATRVEIARSLPGVQFPQLVPIQVTHITSQMVYDPVTIALDASTTAAFGLWAGEPYTAPRNESQLAILRVGLNTVPGDPENEILSFRVSEGQELAWTQGDFVYQLFCRRGVSEPSCHAIARSMIPLDLLLSIGR
ncbi:MAG TPA: hypothetical protein VK960_08730 [Acidimicrobiia bacterium]|nr:hypothetical protein [Acidimicrobiia bacterium]